VKETPKEEFTLPHDPLEAKPERDLSHIASAHNLVQKDDDDYKDDGYSSFHEDLNQSQPERNLEHI
jgi:hypothetical protein